ncbi:MAG: poly(3-hydroxyalkanoate) depolymerase [Proteobacteria bacterium]|nr:poly(3-hydroxyalkanoate) depolymerase [Pseudomonadota bacterium]
MAAVIDSQTSSGQATSEPSIEYVDVDGVMLRVATRPGTGVPLLLFNGIGANFELVFPFMDALPSKEIVIFDIPGTGRSKMWLRPRRFSGLATLANKLLDRMGYREIVVLGVFWGGALAQQFARQFPDRCRRLVLAATSPGAISVPGKPKALIKMVTPMRYISAQYMQKAAPHIYGGEVRKKPHLVAEHGARLIPPSIAGYLYQLIAGMGWTSVHWLHKLLQPTLILAGDDDPIVPPVNSRLMSLLIPNNRLHIIHGGGHLFLVHSTRKVIPIISKFLDAPDDEL